MDNTHKRTTGTLIFGLLGCLCYCGGDWLIMTAVLKQTEEKWLLKLYGEKFAQYCCRVNRCIPFRRSESKSKQARSS